MKKPLEISFHGMDSSPAVEAKLREKADKLNRFYDQIIGCRVVVEQDHSRRHQGNLFKVRLDIKLRGKELAINRHHPKDHAHEDVYVAIRDAFKAAERQLQEHKLVEKGRVKEHEPPPQGKVVSLEPENDCGFIETPEGSTIYFHRNSVLGSGYDSLEVGSKVRFNEEEGEKGLQASTVHPLGKRLPAV